MCRLIISCLPATGFTNASGLAKLDFLFENDIPNSFYVYIEREEDFNWFFDNEHVVRTEFVPLLQNGGEPVATKIRSLFSDITEDEYSDTVYEIIYEYRKKHCLRFGFRGQDVPDIYLTSKAGKLEISRDEGSNRFECLVEFDSFYEQLENAQKGYRNLLLPQK